MTRKRGGSFSQNDGQGLTIVDAARQNFQTRGRNNHSEAVTDLKTSLLRFNIGNAQNDPSNNWTLRDAVRGVQIFGGIGSGKSSGSGATLAKVYLKSGFGFIVLTSKIDEVDSWIEYAKAVGREDDLVIFKEGSTFQFNPLAYEANRKEKPDVLTLTNLFMEMHEMTESYSAGSKGGGSNDQFWDRTVKRFINNAIGLLIMAEEEVSIMNLRKILVSTLSKEELARYNKLRQEFNNPRNIEDLPKSARALQEMMDAYFSLHLLRRASAREGKTNLEEEQFEFLKEYFLKIFPRIPEKTRGIVEESIYGLIEPFMSGVLREHFTEGISEELLPEETFKKGKIIVINFPVKEYGLAGLLAQAIYKRRWQEVVERRNVNAYPIPVVQWIDEAQYFLNKKDAEFQTTARSSRACTVLITQNISNYYAVIGGSNPKDQVNSLLGNLATKIFHGNNDSVTNEWAAATIGKTFRSNTSTNTSLESVNGSTTLSESLYNQIEPQQFTILKGGGEENNFNVEAIVTVAGKQWSNGKNFIQTIFNQNFEP